MLIIDPNKYILFDASVLVAAFNKLDKHHQKASDYIKALQTDKKILLPAQCLFEIQAAASRRIKALSYLSFEKDKLRIPFDNIAITQQLADKARDQGLFSIFGTLKGGDLIYACIAKIYSLPFVTFDRNDFEPYKNEIEIIIL